MHTFTPGQVADAGQVNANFTEATGTPWVQLGTSGAYVRREGKRLAFKGSITRTVAVGSATTATGLTVPADLRPTDLSVAIAPAYGPAGHGIPVAVRVQTDGAITLTAPLSAISQVYLSGVTIALG